MSGQREIAEEVTQEVFLALLSEPGLYDAERGSLQGYLIGVARNKARQALAQSRAWQGEAAETAASAAMLDGLSKEQELAALQIAILSLPPNYREVVVLCDLEELPYAQAAQHLGCAVGTVRSRLHRARAFLGAKLRKQESCPA